MIADQLIRIALWFILGAIVPSFIGCAQNRESTVEQHKIIKTVTKTVRDTLAPSGDIVRLTEITTTITDENGTQLESGRTETEAPQIVGSIAKLAGAAAGAVGGPVAQQVVTQGIGWLEAALGGGSLAATTAATGYVAMRRKSAHDEMKERAEEAERQRNELIDGVERAKAKLKPYGGAWEATKEALEAEQSNDTKAVVRNRTA